MPRKFQLCMEQCMEQQLEDLVMQMPPSNHEFGSEPKQPRYMDGMSHDKPPHLDSSTGELRDNDEEISLSTEQSEAMLLGIRNACYLNQADDEEEIDILKSYSVFANAFSVPPLETKEDESPNLPKPKPPLLLNLKGTVVDSPVSALANSPLSQFLSLSCAEDTITPKPIGSEEMAFSFKSPKQTQTPLTAVSTPTTPVDLTSPYIPPRTVVAVPSRDDSESLMSKSDRIGISRAMYTPGTNDDGSSYNSSTVASHRIGIERPDYSPSAPSLLQLSSNPLHQLLSFTNTDSPVNQPIIDPSDMKMLRSECPSPKTPKRSHVKEDSGQAVQEEEEDQFDIHGNTNTTVHKHTADGHFLVNSKPLKTAIKGLRYSLRKGKRGYGNQMKSALIAASKSKNEGPNGSLLNISKPSPVQPQREAETLKVFMLLILPKAKIFELIQVIYSPTSTTVGDLLAMIPKNATEPALGAHKYKGLCRPKDGTEISNRHLIASKNSKAEINAEIEKGEILVAIPKGFDGPSCARLTKPILANARIKRLLAKSDPLAAPRNPRNKSKRRKRRGGEQHIVPPPCDGERSVSLPTITSVETEQTGSGFGSYEDMGGVASAKPEIISADVKEFTKAPLSQEHGNNSNSTNPPRPLNSSPLRTPVGPHAVSPGQNDATAHSSGPGLQLSGSSDTESSCYRGSASFAADGAAFRELTKQDVNTESKVPEAENSIGSTSQSRCDSLDNTTSTGYGGSAGSRAASPTEEMVKDTRRSWPSSQFPPLSSINAGFNNSFTFPHSVAKRMPRRRRRQRRNSRAMVFVRTVGAFSTGLVVSTYLRDSGNAIQVEGAMGLSGLLQTMMFFLALVKIQKMRLEREKKKMQQQWALLDDSSFEPSLMQASFCSSTSVESAHL